MWRWIAASTVLIGTFGLGMWTAFCLGGAKTNVDIKWVEMNQGEPVAYYVQSDSEPACGYCAASVPAPLASANGAPPKLVDLPYDVQQLVEIAQARPSAAAGTMFESEPGQQVAFVEALTEAVEKGDRGELCPLVNDDRTLGDGPRDLSLPPGDEALAPPSGPEPVAAGTNDSASPLGCPGGVPLVVNDATKCPEVCNSETACRTSEAVATCETPCPATQPKALAALLYQRSKEFDDHACELEEAGELGLADRMRELASEMRDSARVARRAAGELR